MKWKKLTVKTVTDAEDMIISSFYDIGLEGAQIEDHVPLTAWEKEQMFVDILPEGEEDDGTARLSFFVEADEETGMVRGERIGELTLDELLCAMKKELDDLGQFMEIGEGTITVSETEDTDWINNWKQFFHQFSIDDLLVVPSWEEAGEQDKERLILHIDPGTAFGTGMHETTQLCIRQLKKYLIKDTLLLDVGTGSGILSIVALLYGIHHAVGTDLDPCAKDAVAENRESNGIKPEQFELKLGNLITDEELRRQVGFGVYDIVVANILAEVLLPLTPVVMDHLKPGGIYITSGIIDDKEQTVADAILRAGFTILETTYQGEWVSITAQKPQSV